MSTPFKIRLLLFVLSICLAGTALTVDLTLHRNDILQADGRKLERRLNEKERFVQSFLEDQSTFRKLDSLDKNPELASKVIADFSDSRSIYINTYRNNRLVFWGSGRIAIENGEPLKEGITMLRWQNGWYDTFKRTQGNFSVVCFIPVKSEYPNENKYLENRFEKDLISSDNLDIARISDTTGYTIRNYEGRYLFSVKLKPTVTNTFYLEIILWALALFFACVFMNSVCVWIASKGYIKTSFTVFAIFLFLFRVWDLKVNLFYSHLGVHAFRQMADSTSFFFPSIGAFFLNILAVLWLFSYIYSYRSIIKVSEKPPGKPLSLLIFFFSGMLVYLAAYEVDNVFFDLISHTTVNLDLTNILNLDWISWSAILMLCFCVLNLYLLLETILVVCSKLDLTNTERLLVFFAGVLAIFVIKLFIADYSIYFLIFSLIIFLRGWAVYKENNAFDLSSFVSVILAFAILASVKISVFQFKNEQQQRKTIAKRLESADDPNAVALLLKTERAIIKDSLISDFFKIRSNDYELLNEHLQKLYFNGYLSRYSFEILGFTPIDSPGAETRNPIAEYKDMVLSGSTKISGYFYRNNNTFGFQNYFGLLPVSDKGLLLGTLAVGLKSKNLQDAHSFPPVLLDSKATSDDELNGYSFAYYNDGHLVNQYGDYVYNLINNDFKGKIGDFVFLDKNGYNHVVYHLKERRLIVVSKPIVEQVMYLASVSFLFLVLLLFTAIVLILHWLWVTVNDRNIRHNHFKWSYILSRNHILYKTRIQASMIAAIVVTLIIVGFITYFSISYQYRQQQEEVVVKHINQVTEGIESEMLQNSALTYNEQLLNAFTNINATELNLYGPNGSLLYTTQPRIFKNVLQSDKMNTLAYVYLNKYQRSEYIHKEEIGQYAFISAYKPIRNNRNETVAYLNIPDFSNERDFEERIGQFLNTLINIYALVFVAIGFFAVFVANKITYPLTLVQKRLSETKIGRKNEPIVWEREDEIGNLIKEYNKMILALEESAEKFARSERETAWKEMAKQVAHEIKNPLTPLKLGVQLLDKSWREKDPNFNVKFEKFSKSFIEQIESLSHIASEFSNFAKMPETLLENMNLRETIEQSIEVFQPISRITITLTDNTRSNPQVKGDKDQLLRCFNNLIKNAVEAIPDTRPGNIEILMEDIDHYIMVQVSDNGKGIPEGLRERIFNPNFTTKSSGTGLGLAFVKQAIENMSGTIRFETDHEKGTTFYITIPLAPAA